MIVFFMSIMKSVRDSGPRASAGNYRKVRAKAPYDIQQFVGSNSNWLLSQGSWSSPPRPFWMETACN